MDRLVGRQPDMPQPEGDQVRLHHRPSITARLRWSYLISSTLPLLLVGGLLILLNFQTQQRNVYANQEVLTSQIARDISTYIQSIESQLLSFGRGIGSDAPPEQLSAVVNELLATNPDIRQLTIFARQGGQVVRLTDGATVFGMQPDLRSNDSLVLSALQGQGGRSNIYTTEDGQALFTVVLPIRTPMNKVAMALSAQVSAARISQMLRPPGDGRSMVAYLVNERRVIMLTDGNRSWSPPPSLDPLFRPETSVVEYTAGNGETVVASRAAIRPSAWWVITEQSANSAFANVQRSVILLALLVALVGLLALAWALLQAQQLLRPLGALREGAITLGGGHLDHRIDVSGPGEMSQLAWAFNQMAERLQASLSEIEQQNEHLRHGLMLARDIQMGLLPTQPPWSYETLTVYARSIPAYEVGGDFYTYIAQHGGRAAVAIGDISGKGVGAALLMALTSSMVEAQARQIDQPAEILSTLNRLLSPRLRLNRMNAALLFATFDLQAHTMTAANGGMIAPLLVRPRRPVQPPAADRPAAPEPPPTQFLEVGGLPIGAMPNAFYRDITLKLEPGDLVLFLSDGLVEAHNETGEMFGFEWLEALLADLRDSEVQPLVDTVLHQVQHFIGHADQHDDITIVAVRPALLPRSALDTPAPQVDDALPVTTSH